MNIKITSKIPPPISYKQFLAKRKVDESWWLPEPTKAGRTKLRHKIWQTANRMGMRIMARKEGKGMRFWRMS